MPALSHKQDDAGSSPAPATTMKEEDLHIVYTKGSGPGGQHKNKVETCVVVTHIPTGLHERCQDTRSRSRNLKTAKERLRKKIAEREAAELQKKKKKRRIELIQNQRVIKTYNYNRNEVYDHRTKVKRDLRRVLNGEIDY